MTPQTTKPFRFLDLPPEIRLMVYDQIDATTHLHVYDGHQVYGHCFHVRPSDGGTKIEPNDKTLTIVSIHSTLSTSILRISRLIHMEAYPIFAKKLQALANEPLRFVADVAGAHILHSSILYAILYRVILDKYGDTVGTDQPHTSYHVLERVFDKNRNDMFEDRRMEHGAIPNTLANFICPIAGYISSARQAHSLFPLKRGSEVETIIYPHLSSHGSIDGLAYNNLRMNVLNSFC